MVDWKYWKPSNVSFKELIGAKIIEASEEIIIVEKNGRKFAITASDPSGCMNSAGLCYPILEILEPEEKESDYIK